MMYLMISHMIVLILGIIVGWTMRNCIRRRLASARLIDFDSWFAAGKRK